jgi:hypothetical protein
VAEKRAQAVGNAAEAEQIRRRIALASSGTTVTPSK